MVLNKQRNYSLTPRWPNLSKHFWGHKNVGIFTKIVVIIVGGGDDEEEDMAMEENSPPYWSLKCAFFQQTLM